jgi:hypothetical protein
MRAEIMIANLFIILSPDFARVLKIAVQLLLFAVDTDNRISFIFKSLSGFGNDLKPGLWVLIRRQNIPLEDYGLKQNNVL